MNPTWILLYFAIGLLCGALADWGYRSKHGSGALSWIGWTSGCLIWPLTVIVAAALILTGKTKRR